MTFFPRFFNPEFPMVWLCRRAFAGYTGTLYALVLLSGCGSGTEPNGPANITLNPPSLSFNAIGQTQQLSATVTDPQGNPITAAVTWSTSDPAGVSVSSSGAVTAAGSGSAEVTATAGSVHAVAEVTVSQTPTQVEKTQGDGQTVVAGQPVPTPPSVLVTDANHNPVPGVDVTFQVTSGRGQVTPAVVATDNSGIAQVGSWSPGSKGSNVLTATATGAGISGNPVTFTATGTSAFDIEVQFLGSATTSQRQAFTDAAERWETLVTGDVEDIPLQTQAGDCGEGSPALNRTIDDLLIFVTLEHIDGPGGV
ncbi:MAG TPA: Ig-like domain-containing protein, partial [Gemmatimonadales bacterium]|nr:Ig-like domain-containing protein [Gemmatimonadales bacterium]